MISVIIELSPNYLHLVLYNSKCSAKITFIKPDTMDTIEILTKQVVSFLFIFLYKIYWKNGKIMERNVDKALKVFNNEIYLWLYVCLKILWETLYTFWYLVYKFFCVCGAVVWTQGLHLQVGTLQLKPRLSPFCFCYMEMGSPEVFARVGLQTLYSWSQPPKELEL
jgi:hypothetical protein